METPVHSIHALFDQLGLESTHEGIGDFIDKNSPLPNDLALHQADFWSESQAKFLKDAIDENADWSEVVDTLNEMLHQ